MSRGAKYLTNGFSFLEQDIAVKNIHEILNSIFSAEKSLLGNMLRHSWRADFGVHDEANCLVNKAEDPFLNEDFLTNFKKHEES